MRNHSALFSRLQSHNFFKIERKKF